MKTLNAIFASALLIAGAGFAQAGEDVGPDKVVDLVAAGTIKPFDQLNAAALATHPDGVIDETELEDHYGKYIYKVELRDAAGQEWDVDLDASTAAVLSDKKDD